MRVTMVESGFQCQVYPLSGLNCGFRPPTHDSKLECLNVDEGGIKKVSEVVWCKSQSTSRHFQNGVPTVLWRTKSPSLNYIRTEVDSWRVNMGRLNMNVLWCVLSDINNVILMKIIALWFLWKLKLIYVNVATTVITASPWDVRVTSHANKANNVSLANK